jgi:hypothetical protein
MTRPAGGIKGRNRGCVWTSERCCFKWAMSVIAMLQQLRNSQLNRDGLSLRVSKADFAAHRR